MSSLYCASSRLPSAVTHSLRASFTSAGEVNLIIAKHTYLDVLLVEESSLSLMFRQPLYGRVKLLEAFRPHGSDQDYLFILTEKLSWCVLAFNPTTRKMVTKARGNARSGARLLKEAPLGGVDPETRCIGMHAYQGTMKVVPIKASGDLGQAFDARVEELSYLDIVFLHGCARPTLCVLYEDSEQYSFSQGDARRARIKVYHVDLPNKCIVAGTMVAQAAEVEAAELASVMDDDDEEGGGATPAPTYTSTCLADIGAAMLVPLPRGGVLALGHQTISYYEVHDEKASANSGGVGLLRSATKAIGCGPIETCDPIEEDGSRYLVGDYAGRLYVLQLSEDEAGSATLRFTPLHGAISIPSTLTYLDSSVVYVGSAKGNSQLIRLNSELIDESNFEVLQTFDNIGPVVDMVVLPLGRHGQGQLVTCSGGDVCGSLRIVRNGIGIDEQAEIEMRGIKGLWPLRPQFGEGRGDNVLVQSFAGATRALKLSVDEDEEMEMAPVRLPGFDSDAQTLVCANVIGDLVVQVSKSGVALVTCETFDRVGAWAPPAGQRVVLAAASASQVLLTTGGGRLVYLEIDAAARTVVEKTAVVLEHEISCLDIHTLDAAPDAAATICAVGLWTEISVRLLALPSLALLCSEALGSKILPRSVLLHALGGIARLLVGMGDGQLVHFDVEISSSSSASSSAALRQRKSIALGTKPVVLSPVTTEGADGNESSAVFAACDRPVVVHAEARTSRLLYSNVDLDEVSSVCTFNAEGLPSCLAIATDEVLTIGRLEGGVAQKLHIREIPLGAQPRRIAWGEDLRVVCVSTEPSPNSNEGASLRIFDDSTFEQVGDPFTLEPHEMVQSMTYLPRSEEGGAGPGTKGCFVVGTAIEEPSHDDEGNEPNRGRVLLFTVGSRVSSAAATAATAPVAPAAAAAAVASMETEENDEPAASLQLELFSSNEVDGAVYAIEPFGGKVLCSVKNRTMLMRWRRDGAGGAAGEAAGGAGAGAARGSAAVPALLETECKYDGHILTVALRASVAKNLIVVADLMKSITLLEYTPPNAESGETSGRLEERARDRDTNWMLAVAMLHNDDARSGAVDASPLCIGSTCDNNLFCARAIANASTDEVRQ